MINVICRADVTGEPHGAGAAVEVRPNEPVNDSMNVITAEAIEKEAVPVLEAPVDTDFDSSIDYDALYDEDLPEEDLGSLESHGSVLSHLLSQVKIGMDLTKVVLPTFILERRSLLEMYADFFAHPDMFVEIADAPTPKDRMVAVMRLTILLLIFRCVLVAYVIKNLVFDVDGTWEPSMPDEDLR